MDIGKAFGYVFEDEGWISKVLIGGVLIIIPIVNFAVFGYMIKVAQNVAQGSARPLPEWSEFGDHFMRGLYWVAIRLVYLLPAILLYALFACVLAGAAGAAGAASDRGDGGAGAIGALSLCLLPLIFVVGLAGAVLSYVALARYVATNSLSEAFQFSQVVATLRSNLGEWLLLVLIVILAGIIGSLGVIACGIGVLFTSFYAQCVEGHVLGQVVARQRLGAGGITDSPPAYGPPPTY